MRWKEEPKEQQSSKPHLTLRVDSPSELEAARTMVQFMYQQHLPAITSQPLLMTLLQLADRFQVKACTVACAAALGKLELSADTLAQVLRLPPVLCESPLFADMLSKAADQLQQQYGDLEAVWQDDVLRDACFLTLPFKGMELLLADERTQVAYENTALCAASVWLRDHKDDVTEAERDRLAQLIRIPQLTPFFAGGVAMVLPWLIEALGMVTLAHGMSIARASQGEDSPRLQTVMASHVRGDYGWPDSWALGNRPRPPRRGASWEWQVPVRDIGVLFSDADVVKELKSQSINFGGYVWRLELAAVWERGVPGRTLGVFLMPSVPWGVDELPEEAITPVMVTNGSITCPSAGPAEPRVQHFNHLDPPMGWSGLGAGDFWDLGPIQQWSAARLAQWTNGDGQLTLQCKISHIL